MSIDGLEIIPLGGLGEFGMNCLALRYNASMILIDVGLMFSEVGHFGVDILIPDFTYLEKHREELLAVVLTHSHEDHIGSLPFLLKKINVPVYGTPYTLSVVAPKFKEHGIEDIVSLNKVKAGGIIEIGPFSIEFIRVSHSTVDCVALAVTTPVGTVIHTGDYKFDETPVCGDAINIKRLEDYGNQGVLALLSDSTNVERLGKMPSERAVIPGLEEIFDLAQKRIFVSCFASSIHRIQIILDLAHKFGRKVFPIGRGMIRTFDIGEASGFLTIPPGLLLTEGQFKRAPAEEVVVLATGCQGEALAAMSRIARRNHKQIVVEPKDTVILSARNIPGNEKTISRLINDCYRSEAQVFDSSSARIHVSGHGAQEDLRLMLDATRPKYFIPIHGEYRQLYKHKLFACTELGYEPENVILIESGDVLELSSEGAYVIDKVQVGRIYIDDNRLISIDREVMRARKKLAYDGIVIPIISIDKITNRMTSDLEIITHGYVIQDQCSSEIEDLKEIVQQTMSEISERNSMNLEECRETVRIGLKRYIQKLTGQKPIILPVIVPV